MLELITRTEDAGEQATSVGATLDDLARMGAQRMIEAALRVEVEEYVARFRGDAGRGRPCFGGPQWRGAPPAGADRGRAAADCRAAGE